MCKLRLCLIFFVLANCIACDQTTKRLARNHLATSRPLSFLNDTIRLQYVENPGAFLSLGADFSGGVRFWLLTVVVGMLLILLLLLSVQAKHWRPIKLISWTLIVGGGCSNLLDRLFNNGLVADFLNIGVGGVRTGIFNLADVAIMCGVSLLLWQIKNESTHPPDNSSIKAARNQPES